MISTTNDPLALAEATLEEISMSLARRTTVAGGKASQVTDLIRLFGEHLLESILFNDYVNKSFLATDLPRITDMYSKSHSAEVWHSHEIPEDTIVGSIVRKKLGNKNYWACWYKKKEGEYKSITLDGNKSEEEIKRIFLTLVRLDYGYSGKEQKSSNSEVEES